MARHCGSAGAAGGGGRSGGGEQRRSAAAIAEVDEAKSAARRSAEGAQEELRAARDRLQAVREEMSRPRFDRTCRLAADLTTISQEQEQAGGQAAAAGESQTCDVRQLRTGVPAWVDWSCLKSQKKVKVKSQEKVKKK